MKSTAKTSSSQPKVKSRRALPIEALTKTMQALRKKCPWDKQQTRQSLKPFLLEETYEVLETIEEGDPERLKEELGDLLFQIVFHCEIARERGEFDINDVMTAINKKMVSRHPHVFGNTPLKTVREVLEHWEERKKTEGKLRDSILEGVPENLPSLLRAHRLQEKAARVGFDWQRDEELLDKLEEELGEFKEAFKKKDHSEMEDELGDILFMLVNISRRVGVNPEDALRRTIKKFVSRFRHIEKKASQMGVRLSDMKLSDMDKLWQEAKGTHS